MPCDSRYLEASREEITLSQIACLLDELDGHAINRHHWNGYHPAVYNQSGDGDAMVATLCRRLQTVDVQSYSLEMQIWWRDHAEADRQRVVREIVSQATAQARAQALAKLTPDERQLLGL